MGVSEANQILWGGIMIGKIFALLFACALGAPQAFATTMTFKDLTDEEGISTYLENGVTADAAGRDLRSFVTPETAHLDDSGTPIARQIGFAFGLSFAAISFDLLPFRIDDPNIVFDNVFVRGFSSGAEVAADDFFMGTAPNTYLFDASFGMIDLLVIGVTNNGAPGDYCVTRAPCTHLNIDNVVLASSADAKVPAPAALPLIATALGVLFVVGRRRRSAA